MLLLLFTWINVDFTGAVSTVRGGNMLYGEEEEKMKDKKEEDRVGVFLKTSYVKPSTRFQIQGHLN